MASDFFLPDAGGGPAADYDLAVASLRLKATAALALALDDVALARRRGGAATAAVGGARVDCDGPRLRCAAPLATATADAATRRASVAVGAATLSLSDALAAAPAAGAAAVAAAWAGGALADAAEPAAPAEPWAVDASFAPLTVARGAVALTIRGLCSWRGGAGGGEVDVEDLSVDGAALLVSPARAKATVRASGDGDVACAVDVAPLRAAAAPAALAALHAAAAVGGGGGGASRAGRVSATVLLRGLDVAVDGVGALRLGPAGLNYARGAGDGAFAAAAAPPAVDAGGGAALVLEPLGGAGAAPCGVVLSGTVGDGATLDARLAALDGVAVLEPSAYPLAGFGALPAARLRCDVGRLLAARRPAAPAPPPAPAAAAAVAALAALAAFTARARLGGLEVDVDARIAYRAGGGQSWTCDADASRVAVAFDGVSLLPTLRRAPPRARSRSVSYTHLTLPTILLV